MTNRNIFHLSRLGSVFRNRISELLETLRHTAQDSNILQVDHLSRNRIREWRRGPLFCSSSLKMDHEHHYSVLS